MMFRRAPLTEHLKKNKELIKYMGSIEKKIIPISTMKSVVNPYPACIEQHHAWSYFGTFVDYMIRRMIRARYSLPKSELIAEQALQKLQKRYQYMLNTKEGTQYFDTEETFKEAKDAMAGNGMSSYILPPKGDPLVTPADREHFKECIDIYNDLSIQWQDTIDASLEMTRLDEYFRAGRMVQKITFSPLDLEAIQSFLIKTEQFLSSIEFQPPIMLNPVLGIKGVPADADIIDDNMIFDIKTSKSHPETRVVYQLLGYAALYFHRSHKKINTLAILNPIYCMMQVYDASSITEDELATIIKKLLRE